MPVIKKMPLARIIAPTSYDALARRAYRGEVLQFNCQGKLLRAARALCRNVFDLSDIENAHRKFGKRKFLLRAATIQQAFNTPEYKALFRDCLAEIGVDTGDLYWDTLGMRIAPPVSSHAGGFRSHVGVHRDTWGVGIQQQINWWAPITPLSYKRTMAFYPEWWTMKLKNSSDTWSFQEYLESRRQAKKAGKAAAYPSAPKNTETPWHPPHLIKPECGAILAFSSAHLHASVTNQTDKTRFSFEIRTVSASHIKSNIGAPNVDCASTPPLYQLFRAVSDSEIKLSDALA